MIELTLLLILGMAWALDQNIKGPTGDAGPQGPAGTNGINGTNGTDGSPGEPSMTWLYDDDLTGTLPSAGYWKFTNGAFDPDNYGGMTGFNVHNEAHSGGGDDWEEFLDAMGNTSAGIMVALIRKTGSGPEKILINLTAAGTSNSNSQSWAMSSIYPTGSSTDFPADGDEYYLTFWPKS